MRIGWDWTGVGWAVWMGLLTGDRLVWMGCRLVWMGWVWRWRAVVCSGGVHLCLRLLTALMEAELTLQVVDVVVDRVDPSLALRALNQPSLHQKRLERRCLSRRLG